MKTSEGLMRKAVELWGRESQLNMVIEECAELINAIQKRRRNRVDDNDILSEGVDVELCLEQLKLILDNPVRWRVVRDIKLDRLQALIYKETL